MRHREPLNNNNKTNTNDRGRGGVVTEYRLEVKGGRKKKKKNPKPPISRLHVHGQCSVRTGEAAAVKFKHTKVSARNKEPPCPLCFPRLCLNIFQPAAFQLHLRYTSVVPLPVAWNKKRGEGEKRGRGSKQEGGGEEEAE